MKTNGQEIRSHLCEDVISGCSDGVLVIDQEMRYIVWNPAMERISGVAAEQTLGQVCFEIFPFLRETGEEQRMRQSLGGERVLSENRPFTTSAGKQGYFNGIYSPIRGDNGNVVAACGVITDATERALLHDFLQPQTHQEIWDEVAARTRSKMAAALGRAIFDRRKILAISQEELAHRACLHRTYVSDVERGARSISITTLEKLAYALKIPAWVLLGIAESQSTDSKLLERLWR